MTGPYMKWLPLGPDGAAYGRIPGGRLLPDAWVVREHPDSGIRDLRAVVALKLAIKAATQ